MATPPKPTQPNLEVPPELEIIYANLARISHSPADIVLDFAHLLPGEQSTKVGARIVMSPLSAKLLYRALGENLNRYEAAFGEIRLPGNASLADRLFGPFQSPDPPKQE